MLAVSLLVLSPLAWPGLPGLVPACWVAVTSSCPHLPSEAPSAECVTRHLEEEPLTSPLPSPSLVCHPPRSWFILEFPAGPVQGLGRVWGWDLP